MASNAACSVCHLPSPFICSGCLRARYCSRACQRLHWRASHKQSCERAVAAAAEQAAADWYPRAKMLEMFEDVQQGMLDAIHSAGTLYLHGASGFECRSEEVALRLFEMGAAFSHGDSLLALGRMHRAGRGGLQPSTDAALGLFERAAAASSENHARLEAAHTYRDMGRLREAAESYERAFSDGWLAGAIALGEMLAHGEGMPRDVAAARELFMQVRAAGHCRNTAVTRADALLRETALGGSFSPTTSCSSLLRYTPRMADLAPAVLTRLSCVLQLGHGGVGEYHVERSEARSLALLRMASDAGHAPAQYALGMRLGDEALLERAARGGHARAQVHVGYTLWHDASAFRAAEVNAAFLTAGQLRRLEEGGAWVAAAAAAGDARAAALVAQGGVTARRAVIAGRVALGLSQVLAGAAFSASFTRATNSVYTAVARDAHARVAAARLPPDGSLLPDDAFAPLWQQLQAVQQWLRAASALPQPGLERLRKRSAAYLRLLRKVLQSKGTGRIADLD